MDFVEAYSFAELEDSEKKEMYRNLLIEYRRAIKTVDAFTKVCSRLSDY